MIQENPAVQKSHWDTLDKYRVMFETISENVAVELEMERPRVSKRLGALVLDGGPYIHFEKPFVFRSSQGKDLERSKSTLFTWTSKMSCASFSIPAGPINRHGSCPAAVESAVVKADAYRKFHARIDDRPTRGSKEDPSGKYICDVCYAGKSNYLVYKTISLNQMAHMKWAFKTLQLDANGRDLDLGRIEKFDYERQLEAVTESSFVRQMTAALRFIQDPKVAEMLARKLVSTEYFRIHDGGDFFHPWYFLAWLAVTRALPKIRFWAPTRVWAYQNWQELFKSVEVPDNFALRPSGLVISMGAPKVPFMDAGTTSFPDGVVPPRPVKSCPAYDSDDAEHSCARAECRTCWDEKDVEVSYRTH